MGSFWNQAKTFTLFRKNAEERKAAKKNAKALKIRKNRKPKPHRADEMGQSAGKVILRKAKDGLG